MFTELEGRQEMVGRMEALISGHVGGSMFEEMADEGHILQDLEDALQEVVEVLARYRLCLKRDIAVLGQRAIRSETAKRSHLLWVETSVRSSFEYADKGIRECQEAVSGIYSQVEELAWEERDTLEARLME